MLRFYDVDSNYVKYLKKFDSKIPNFDYKQNNKFVCGIVLKINGCSYYAPVSSNKQTLKTSFPIYDRNKIVSTIRFSFMFPIPDSCCSVKDFSKETNPAYKALLKKEWRYCLENSDRILKQAQTVYTNATELNIPVFVNNCCNFKLLEKAYIEYCTAHKIELPEALKDKHIQSTAAHPQAQQQVKPSAQKKPSAAPTLLNRKQLLNNAKIIAEKSARQSNAPKKNHNLEK